MITTAFMTLLYEITEPTSKISKAIKNWLW